MPNKRTTLGIVLIVAGLISGLASLNLVSGFVFFYLIALGFWAAYYMYDRNLGFLIPACVLTALGTFVLMNENIALLPGSFFLTLLGAAFLAVFLIHTVHEKKENWGARYWPLFPAMSLIAISSLVIAAEKGALPFDVKYVNLINPLLLIGLGLIIYLRGRKSEQ